ncbi:unnamed protein product [Trichobilharzia szidati]|nr:unnamed protein product [Trichobilharzia szidati]
MRCFLLFISFSILLHVQQSTQDDLQTIKMKQRLVQQKLLWNEANLKKNNATLTNLAKRLQETIENINTRLSPHRLSVDKYVACISKQMKADTGVELMESLVEAIEKEKKISKFITSDTEEMKECFQNKKKIYEAISKSEGWEKCSPDHPEALNDEIDEMTNLMTELYSEIKKQAETVFKRKLYTFRSNELEQMIPEDE